MPAPRGWPEVTPTVELPGGGRVRLRPLTRRDGALWSQYRLSDRAVLQPVEPTVHDWEEAHSLAGWRRTFPVLKEQARAGTLLPFAVELDGTFVGQLTVGNIQRGVVCEGWIGYWLFSQYWGRGVATAAVALGVDHAFGRAGLHRLTATFLPDNVVSQSVLQANGFREEGFLREALHIDGRWRDHVLVALNRNDFPVTAVRRLEEAGKLRLR
ncbi:MAG: GNAT family protein [Corynebacterium sp.]|nr:GNAT family protein [Corynebacterium sp.]